jgi:S1 RNA binding domain protein
VGVTGAVEIAIGTVVEGTVTGIVPFGAFVFLPNGKTGLVHISEVAAAFVQDVREHLQVQARVFVKVIGVDEKGKIALSIKQADPNWEPRPQRRHSNTSFEEKLARFMKDSEDRMTDLRRLESKRGGRGGRHG